MILRSFRFFLAISFVSSYVVPYGTFTFRERLLNKPYVDPILLDPEASDKSSTAPSLQVTTEGILSTDPYLDNTNKLVAYSTASTPNKYYLGTTSTYLDLVDSKTGVNDGVAPRKFLIAPPPKLSQKPPKWLQTVFKKPNASVSDTASVSDNNYDDDEYIPMRDLFTSPFVPFLYERGWRQGFANAGFPGVDEEYKMVKSYFEDNKGKKDVVVDMSCGSGLMTRKFYFDKTSGIERLLACDFSDSMLLETRNRIERTRKRLLLTGKLDATEDSDPDIENSGENGSSSNLPRLDLLRVDVANLPIRSSSVGCLHAGAAMHCWPDVDKGLSEIYRVLQDDGGLYFASTFLSPYFRVGSPSGEDETDVTKKAFQMFDSAEELKSMVEKAGFQEVSVTVEGKSCAIIRAKKTLGETKIVDDANEFNVVSTAPIFDIDEDDDVTTSVSTPSTS